MAFLGGVFRGMFKGIHRGRYGAMFKGIIIFVYKSREFNAKCIEI